MKRYKRKGKIRHTSMVYLREKDERNKILCDTPEKSTENGKVNKEDMKLTSVENEPLQKEGKIRHRRLIHNFSGPASSSFFSFFVCP